MEAVYQLKDHLVVDKGSGSGETHRFEKLPIYCKTITRALYEVFPENWKTEVEIFMLKLIEASFGLKAKLYVARLYEVFQVSWKTEVDIFILKLIDGSLGMKTKLYMWQR